MTDRHDANRGESPRNRGKPGYLDVLRECPGFRLLFFARVISLGGDWLSMIAIVALLREVTGSSPMALSGLLILKLLPFAFVGPLAGVAADRFSRKGIMVLADLARTGFVLAMLLAPWTSRPVEFVYLMVLLQVVGSAFFEPARSAAVPNLVPDRYLSSANALGAIMWSVVFAVGAAAGGLMTHLLGWRTALALDALTYVASAILVSRIVLPRRARRRRGSVDWMTLTGVRDIRDGLRFIARRRDVATVLFVKTGWGLGGAAALFLTLFGERVYAIGGRPDLGVALLYIARAVGTGIGPLLARRFVTDESPRSMRRLLGISFIWPAIWYAVFGQVHSVVPAVACVVLAHFGGSVLWVYSSVLLQRMVPDEYRGRVMATDLGLATLAISASTWFYGYMAARPGADLRTLVTWMAISLVIPTVVWLLATRTDLPTPHAGETRRDEEDDLPFRG